MMRLKVNSTSAAVNGSPSCQVTSRRRWNVQVSPSSECSHDSANAGSTSSVSQEISVSPSNRVAQVRGRPRIVREGEVESQRVRNRGVRDAAARRSDGVLERRRVRPQLRHDVRLGRLRVRLGGLRVRLGGLLVGQGGLHVGLGDSDLSRRGDLVRLGSVVAARDREHRHQDHQRCQRPPADPDPAPSLRAAARDANPNRFPATVASFPTWSITSKHCRRGNIVSAPAADGVARGRLRRPRGLANRPPATSLRAAAHTSTGSNRSEERSHGRIRHHRC